MDSLPQELIDRIIDNLPLRRILRYSLVAKRWRRRTQQRAFEKIKFFSEDDVNRWCTNVPQDSDGLSSYVQRITFEEIASWNDPTAPGRVLKNFSSLIKLRVSESAIPNELPAQMSRGEFGKGITILHILFPLCTLAPIVSMILSLPNLKMLRIAGYAIKSGEPLSTHPVALQREPLDLLEIHGDVCGLGEALVRSRLTSRHLFLEVRTSSIKQLMIHSSETMVELNLNGVWFLKFSGDQKQ